MRIHTLSYYCYASASGKLTFQTFLSLFDIPTNVDIPHQLAYRDKGVRSSIHWMILSFSKALASSSCCVGGDCQPSFSASCDCELAFMVARGVEGPAPAPISYSSSYSDMALAKRLTSSCQEAELCTIHYSLPTLAMCVIAIRTSGKPYLCASLTIRYDKSYLFLLSCSSSLCTVAPALQLFRISLSLHR